MYDETEIEQNPEQRARKKKPKIAPAGDHFPPEYYFPLITHEYFRFLIIRTSGRTAGGGSGGGGKFDSRMLADIIRITNKKFKEEKK